MSSAIQPAAAAIVALWLAQTTVPVARRNLTELGAPKFDRPQIPDVAGLTTATRQAKLAAAIWVRFAIDFVPGTTRPQGIDPSSRTRTTGVIRRHFYFPLGLGSDAVFALVDLERSIFHRANLASGLVQCRDTEAPLPIDVPADRDAGWGRLDMSTPFWLTEAIA